jgi:hypothetical protein
MKRKGIIIVAAAVGVLLAGMLGAELWLRHKVRDAVENALGETGAEVELGRVSVSLPRRAVSVRGVRVKEQNRDLARRGFTVVSLDAGLSAVTVTGIGYKKVSGRAALSADRVVVDGPWANVVTRGGGRDSLKAADSLPAAEKPFAALSEKPFAAISEKPFAALSEKLASLKVNEVEVRGMALELVQWISEGESTRAVLGGGEVSVRGVTLDSLPADIGFSADSVVYAFGAGAKVLRADSVVLKSAARKLSLGRFALVPQFPKDEFAGRVKTHEDWMAITVEGISCEGVDFGRLIADKTLAIDSVLLASADMESYKNRKIFRQPRTKLMLYQAVQRLPISVDIGVMAYENVDIRYDELSENGASPGTVLLSGGKGKAMNVTNIVDGNERFMTIDLDALFMASGALKARFLFPVDAADDYWELSGRLGQTDMAAFNRALEPLVNARITSGRIESIDFNITGTLRQSHSTLTMVYHDLDVELLDKHDHTRERKFLTFLADGILIRHDNPAPRGSGKPREAEGGHTRDPERSMWNYIWHSLMPAVIKTVV